MPIRVATDFVRVDASSVAQFIVDPSKTYTITNQVFHNNVRMGMIAVPTGYPDVTQTYLHRTFSRRHGQTHFQWQPQGDGYEFTTVYFYLLLRSQKWQNRANLAPYADAYTFGRGAGEPGVLNVDKVASITVEKKEEEGAPAFSDRPGSSYLLPSNVIELQRGYHISLSPIRNAETGHPMEWVEFKVRRERRRPSIELKTRIHITAGGDGDEILGIIKPDYAGDHSLHIGDINSTNNAINIFALVAPTINPQDSGDFTFEVGDPEKDGRITISSV